MRIRIAREEDLPALLAIYNYEVRHGVATFDTEEATLPGRRAWLLAHNRDNHPLFVAEEGGAVLGYVSLSVFSAKPAYDGTVELSLYVAPDARGRGVGGALLEHIISWARQDARTHALISIITAENAVSRHLHERLGFRLCGTLHEVGWKFGRWLDVAYYELKVDGSGCEIPKTAL